MRCKRSILFPVIGLMLTVVLPAAAQQATLRYRPPAGSLKVYDAQFSGQGKIRFQLPGNNTEQDIALAGATRVSEGVVSASTDGYRTVEARFLSANITQNGQPVPLNLVGRSMKFRRDLLGRVFSFEGAPLEGGGANNAMGFDPLKMVNDLSRMVTFPQQAVGVGDNWANEFEMPSPDGSRLRVSTQSALKQFSTAAGRSIATVDTVARIPLVIDQAMMRISGQMNATVRTNYYVDDGTVAGTKSRMAIKLTIYNIKQDGTPEPMGSFEMPDLQAVVTEAN